MKKTPLYQWHKDNGANMAEFASYSMPLWYPQGVKNEHIGVIKSCGLFDTSHMAVIILQGLSARSLLQEAFSKNLESCLGPAGDRLVAGRCVYGVFLNDNGHVIDDALVYQQSETIYMVVVNAGMGGKICAHLSDLVRPTADSVKIFDMTDRLGKIDIQGPASAKIVAELIRDPAQVFTGLVYFSFKGWFEPCETIPSVVLKDGTPILLSRTGYTGEFGFEIFIDPQQLERLWSDLLRIGGDRIAPCGLAARDSLRAGAVLPLSHQDIGDWQFSANPWQFALPTHGEGKFSKSFVGAEALQQPARFYTYAFAGFDPRKIATAGNTSVLDEEGKRIGDVLTCTTDMAIGRHNNKIHSIATSEADGRPADFAAKGLSCGFVRVERPLEYGDTVHLAAGKRKITVEIRKDVRPNRTARRSLQDLMQ